MKGKQEKSKGVGKRERPRNELKRGFEKAKLFEVRRLVRRIRQLESKKGTDEQVKKNQRKVKRMEEQLEFAKEVKFEIIFDYLQEKSGGKLLEEKEITGATTDCFDARNVVLDRLLNSLDIEVLASFNSDGDFQKESAEAQESLTENSKSRRSDAHESGIRLDSVQNVFRSTNVQNQSNLTKKALLKKHDVTTKDKKKRKRKISVDSNEDSISRATESMFHGSMEKLLDSPIRKTSKRQKKDLKKNRLGQRARQKMWEKLYGKKAKHCLDAGKEENKRKKSMKDSQVKKAEEVEYKAMHPSWEASKSKRKKETIVEFTGQKITFDD